jgi:hypothetical protein
LLFGLPLGLDLVSLQISVPVNKTKTGYQILGNRRCFILKGDLFPEKSIIYKTITVFEFWERGVVI